MINIHKASSLVTGLNMLTKQQLSSTSTT